MNNTFQTHSLHKLKEGVDIQIQGANPQNFQFLFENCLIKDEKLF